MSEESLEKVLVRFAMDRRAFVKKLILGTAFAIPLTVSFDMQSLSARSTQVNTSNGTATGDTGTSSEQPLPTASTPAAPADRGSGCSG